MKSEICEYYEYLKDAHFVIKEGRMQEINDACNLIKEFVKRSCCEDDTSIRITHDEYDLRKWQIRIRSFSVSLSRDEIEELKSIVKTVDLITVDQADNDEIEIVLEFNDVATMIL